MQDKPSLYAHYVKSREDFDIVEDEFCFATYKITGEECYVRDVFVRSDMRRHGFGSRLIDKIVTMAIEKSCKKLITTVCPSAVGSTDSLRAVLGYEGAKSEKFELEASQQNFIIFKLDLRKERLWAV